VSTRAESDTCLPGRAVFDGMNDRHILHGVSVGQSSQAAMKWSEMYLAIPLALAVPLGFLLRLLDPP
jgi:hypothetical protein